MTIKQEKERLTHELSTVSDAPAFEATELLIAATGIPRGSILYKGDQNLSKGQQRVLRRNVLKRKKGIPLQYILGEWEFYSLHFKVGRGVLIPRADSELLVDLALEELSSTEPAVVFDLCSGSGAIGIAVAKNRREAKVTLVEKSRKAFGFLKENLLLNKVKVKSVRDDIFRWTPKNKADIILCNPPYIDKDEMKTLQREVRYEPNTALFGGKDGLKFYRLLCHRAGELLKTGGKMMVEIGFKQGDAVSQLFKEAGFENVEVLQDITGNDRVVSGTYNPHNNIQVN